MQMAALKTRNTTNSTGCDMSLRFRLPGAKFDFNISSSCRMITGPGPLEVTERRKRAADR